MKILKITFLFVMLSVSVFGKDSTGTGFNRFAFSLHVSPDFCYRTLKNNNGTESSSNVIAVRNSFEIPKLGITAGIGLEWKIKRSCSLELGIHYSNKGYQTAWQEIYNYPHPNTIADPAIPKRYKQKYNFTCVDIPLIANFKFGKKKLSFTASAGIVTNLILFERVRTYKDFDDGGIKKDRSVDNYIYNPWNFSPMIGLGSNLKLGEKTTLKFLPTLRYGITQIIDAPVTGYLWNAGLDIGLYIDL